MASVLVSRNTDCRISGIGELEFELTDSVVDEQEEFVVDGDLEVDVGVTIDVRSVKRSVRQRRLAEMDLRGEGEGALAVPKDDAHDIVVDEGEVGGTVAVEVPWRSRAATNVREDDAGVAGDIELRDTVAAAFREEARFRR